MISLWKETAGLPEFPEFKGNAKTDVLIIGGGMAGLLCAYFLKHAGINYMLVEARRICDGNTGNTTAKITSQHGVLYDKLIREEGFNKAKMYLKANEAAVSQFNNLCKGIECGFEKKSAFIYSLHNRQTIEKETEAAQKLGMNALFRGETKLPFKISGAVEFKNQAQFHPLLFASHISKNLNIYENTRVVSVDGKIVLTDRGKIKADNIIVATHFPFINTKGSYFIKLYQSRSYVQAFQNAMDVDGMYIEDIENGMSMRNYNELLIIGGGGHKTGDKSQGWKKIYDFASEKFPQSRTKYYWAAQDCMSLDSIPYIGKYSKSSHNLYTATGFNKWGMTGSMISAMIITDMIKGRRNAYSEVFLPSRSIMKPQLITNGINAVKNLLSSSPKRCPHMGCSLKWNKHEHTWDCPCHGSRFSKKGELLDNPANGGIKP